MASHKRILVTGASGFLGRHALAPLRRLGFEVHAVSSKPVDAGTMEGSGPGDAHWHRADLLDARQSRAVMESVRPTHVLHFAWYAEHGKFWKSPLNLDWASATLALLKAFAEAGGTRFVGAGSCAEYEWTERDLCQENDPLRPGTLYGAAKASTCLTGEAYARSADMEFAWGRIFHLFGPHEAPDRIIPALIRAHLRNETLACSQGTQLRDFLPAMAVADAFAHICDRGGDSGVQGAVNIGSGEAITLRALSELIAARIGQKADIRFGAFHDAGPAKLLPALERLNRIVGWRPPVTLETGLADAVEWWKTQGDRT